MAEPPPTEFPVLKQSSQPARGGSRRPSFEERVALQKAAQEQAKILRAVLRWIILGCGFAGLALLLPAAVFSIFPLIGPGMTLLFTSFVAIVVLFFMGGLAPESVRQGMSERERRKLDS